MKPRFSGIDGLVFEQIDIRLIDMRKPKFLIIVAAINLLFSAIVAEYSGLKSFPRANSVENPQVSEATPAATPSPDHADRLKLTPEQSAQLADKLAKELAKPEPPRYKLCNGNSDSDLRLPLKEVDPLFKACADDLLKLTQVPLMLPPVSPQSFEDKKLHAFFYMPFTNINRYYIGLTWMPGEYYQTQRAWFGGEKLTPQSPTLAAYYEKESAFAKSSPFHKQKPGPVSLSHRIRGYYLPAVCGASCHAAYASVTWEQGGYRYQIGLKMAKKEEVLKMVNAAIENQRSSPTRK